MTGPEMVVADAAELADTFAGLCARAAAAAIADRGRFVLVIPGGSAAEKLLPRLTDSDLDWSRTEVFYSDERFVPRGDADSSASAARRLLFDALGAKGPRVHAMVDDVRDAGTTRSEERRVGKECRL